MKLFQKDCNIREKFTEQHDLIKSQLSTDDRITKSIGDKEVQIIADEYEETHTLNLPTIEYNEVKVISENRPISGELFPPGRGVGKNDTIQKNIFTYKIPIHGDGSLLACQFDMFNSGSSLMFELNDSTLSLEIIDFNESKNDVDVQYKEQVKSLKLRLEQLEKCIDYLSMKN